MAADPHDARLLRSLSTGNLKNIDGVRREIEEDLQDAPHNLVGFFTVMSFYTFVFPMSDLNRQSKEVKDFVISKLTSKAHQTILEKDRIINWFKNCAQLLCLNTRGDGSCLLHSASLSMWGIHDSQGLLRGALYTALRESHGTSLHDRWQAEMRIANHKFGMSLDPKQWSVEWQKMVDRVNPRKQADYKESLDDFHIFVLANILRRPIIVYGSSKIYSNQSGASLQENMIPGIYLPILWASKDTWKNPLLFSFSGAHFSALVIADDAKMKHPPCCPLVSANGNKLPVKFILGEENDQIETIKNEYLNISYRQPPQLNDHFEVAAIDIQREDKSHFFDVFWNEYLEKAKEYHTQSYGGGLPCTSSTGQPVERGGERPRCVQCNSPGASVSTNYLCDDCYKEQMAVFGGTGHQRRPSDDGASNLPDPYGSRHDRIVQPPNPVKFKDDPIECQTPGCNYFGYPSTAGYCTKCYDKRRQNVPGRCAQCQQDDGVPQFGGLCYGCHSKNMKLDANQEPRATSASGGGTLAYNNLDEERRLAGSQKPNPSGIKRCTYQGCTQVVDPGCPKLCSAHFFRALANDLPGFDMRWLTQEEDIPQEPPRNTGSGRGREGPGYYDNHQGTTARIKGRCTYQQCGKQADPSSNNYLCSEHFVQAVSDQLPDFDKRLLAPAQEGGERGGYGDSIRHKDPPTSSYRNQPIGQDAFSRGRQGYNTEPTGGPGQDDDSGFDLPAPITTQPPGPNPVPRPRRTDPNASRGADLGNQMTKLNIQGKEPEASTMKCFMCTGQEPDYNPYGHFLCSTHTKEVTRMMKKPGALYTLLVTQHFYWLYCLVNALQLISVYKCY